eukprot:2247405-Pyramimonas_sp.AAC.1
MAEAARAAGSMKGLHGPTPSPAPAGAEGGAAPPPAPEVQSEVPVQLSALTAIVKEGFTTHTAEFELFRQQMTVMGTNFDRMQDEFAEMNRRSEARWAEIKKSQDAAIHQVSVDTDAKLAAVVAKID